MGEAILVKAGGLGGNGGTIDPEDQNIVDWQLKTELITNSKEFIVPKAKNQQFSVRLFGGGGGPTCTNIRNSINSNFINADRPGYAAGNSWFVFGGGSGNMNFKQLKLTRGDVIPIIIGVRGNNSKAGSSTTFGNYLSATGGSPIDIINKNGGNGGVGTPPFILADCTHGNYGLTGFISGSPVVKFNAGISTYGGGSGGICIKFANGTTVSVKGSNGGIYGGGGGTYNGDTVKTGGNGCGNGGNGTVDAKNGVNTTGMILDFEGNGDRGQIYEMGVGYNGSKCCGGGGYGGCGGTGVSNGKFNDGSTISWGGGGGGYGNGNGIGPKSISHHFTQNNDYNNHTVAFIGGYGGAYGSPQNSYSFTDTDYYGRANGYGGGGYGQSQYSGGGLFSTFYSGMMEPYNAATNCYGKNGICILSYYAPVYNNG